MSLLMILWMLLCDRKVFTMKYVVNDTDIKHSQEANFESDNVRYLVGLLPTQSRKRLMLRHSIQEVESLIP